MIKLDEVLCTVTALCALGGVSGSRLGCPLPWHHAWDLAEAWDATPQAAGCSCSLIHAACSGQSAAVGTLLGTEGRTC